MDYIIYSILILIILIQFYINRKTREKSLSMFKNIVDHINIGVTVTKENKGRQVVIYANSAFEEMTGYRKKEIIGKDLNFLQNNDTQQAANQDLRNAIQSRKECQAELRNYKKNGTLFYNFLSIIPILDKRKRLVYYIGIQHDTTKQKQREKQLEHQSKLAAMGEMIVNISHQWRQPLSMISTAATGIITKKEFNLLTDQFLLDSCSQINENSQYLSQTLDDFRNYIEGDKKVVRFDLKNDTRSFINIVDSSIKAYDLQIILDLQEHIEVKGYPNELIQAFINIFNNAKDALAENNDPDNRFIFITQRVRHNNIIIKFKDNAGGIDENIIDKVFEPYFTTKHKSLGTGLGLHMTYNLIVNKMRGTIDVKNEEFGFNDHIFKGAVFTLTLPFK